MGENGNAGISPSLDYANRWVNSGGSFSSEQAHTGRYSIKVVDNFGPGINLYLQDVTTLGYGYKASVWIYDTNTVQPPVFSLERRNAAGALIDIHQGSSVDGYYQPNRWQRWEINLTNANLTANNLFQPGVNDRLVIYAGTGAPVNILAAWPASSGCPTVPAGMRWVTRSRVDALTRSAIRTA